MSLKEIITVPNEMLKKTSEPIEKVGVNERKLIGDLFDTMYHSNGIGLAAVQVGILKRLIVIDISKEDEKKNPIFFVNPEIIYQSDKTSTYEEGCLSLPGFYAEVERPTECHINYLDYNGKRKKLEADGLLATCIQHEVDHLNGILFIDHLTRLKKNMIWQKILKNRKMKK